jgi:hypothetical protein
MRRDPHKLYFIPSLGDQNLCAHSRKPMDMITPTPARKITNESALQGPGIRRTFREEQLEAVPGLKEIVEAISHLPDAIGWGDEPPPSDDVGRSGL